ncbi:hypothetical protein G6F65_017640 [Rhizopus arrhizus]|nr:hypothetical protein G6F65_017640 [Rhizopus arrhizus]
MKVSKPEAPMAPLAAIGARVRPMTATTAPVTTGGMSRVGQAAGDDSAQRHADIGVGPAAGIPCDGDHPADEGEA